MTDTLETLEASLEHLKPALEARQLGSILGKVTEKTADAGRQAQRCEALIDIAISIGGLGSVQVLDAAKAAARTMKEAGEGLASAKDVEDLEIIQDEFTQLASALSRLDQSLRQLWAERARTDYLSLVPVGTLLGQLSGAEQLGRDLAALGARADGLAQRNQPATTMASEIKQLQTDREALLGKLTVFTANPDVETFIVAVTTGRATLDLVNQSVLDWLSLHGGRHAFKVTG